MMNPDKHREGVVDQLNAFLRGELSAVETYRQALEKVKDHAARAVLHDGQKCHLERTTKLQEKIREFGGQPASDSGPWGTFAKLIEGAAAALGDSAAIAALEEGEDEGLRDYEAKMANLDTTTIQWLQIEILHRQQETHAQLGELKKKLAAQS